MASTSVPIVERVPAAPVSLPQLYLLRAGYLLIAVGLAFYVWPDILHNASWPLWEGLTNSLLGALSILAILGVRYPLKMLPLLLFELTWKTIWLLSVALPVWLSHAPIGPAMAEKIQACLLVVIFLPIIPWRFVFATYFASAADRWR